MPRVPQYEQQVRVQNLPSARERNFITPEVLGSDIARGVGQVATTLQGVAQAEQEKADVAALMDADRQLADLELRMFNDPEQGAYATRGRDAFGLPDRVFPEWDKAVGQIDSRLTPAQRAAFQRQAQGRRTDLQRGLSRHILQESERFYSEEAKAYISTAVQSAAANYTDPDRVEMEAERATRGVLSMPDMRGASPIVINAAIKEARASVYGGVVERLLNDNPQGAISYFDGVQDRLTPAQVARLEPKVREARNTALAFQEADAALYGTPASSDDYMSFMRRLESGGRADARNPNSTATGADQFIESTWLEMVNSARPAWAAGKSRDELLALRTDPIKSGEMAQEYARRNGEKLVNAGLPADNINLYAAHHFGPGGGIKFARAGMDTPIEDILTPEQIAANGYLAGKTKGEVIANWSGRAGGGASTTSEAEVYKRLAAIQDPDVRRLAESRAGALLRAREAEEKQARETALEAAYGHIQGGGTLADMPADVRMAIPPSDLIRVETYERQRRENVPSDRTAYNEIADLAALRPLEFASPGWLESHRDKLDDKDYQSLVDARRKMREGQDDEFVAARRTQESITRQAMVQLGYAERPARQDDPLKPKSGREGTVNAFRDQLAMQADYFTRVNGKVPNEAEVQDMADRLLVKQTITTVRNWLPDSTDEVAAFENLPQAPRDASQRTAGTIYSTPRGPLLWAGNGWSKPRE